MNKKLLLLTGVSALALTGCNGLVKCDFDDFKEAAAKTTEKAKTIKSATYKGTLDDKEIEVDSSNVSGIEDLAYYAILKIVAVPFQRVESMYTFALSNETTFYKTLGFKVKVGDAKYEYNGKGYLTKMTGKSDNHTFKLKISSYKYND